MSAFLTDLKKEYASHPHANLFFAAEYHNGQIHTETFANTNPCQNIYSVTKAFIVTAIGLLADQGLLSPPEYLTAVLADELPASYNQYWDTVTVHDLLLHHTALPEGFLDIDCLDASAFGSDYLSYTLNAPLRGDYTENPYTYTDAAFYLLSRIVEKRSGMGCDNFLWKYLFFPTGCREAAFSHCPQGHTMGATGLYIRTEDMVKLGMLYLHGGIYNGKRILSQSWVNTVLENGYELKSICRGKAFGKGGMRGQMLMLIPEADRVVAWQGCSDENNFTEFAANYP